MVKVKAFPKHASPFLVAGWSPDSGETGWWVVDYLNQRLLTREFAEIEPVGFFSLGGVEIRDNISRFPESKFFSSAEKDLIFFKSNIPATKGYNFLNLVLDVAKSFNVRGVYTVGGIVSMIAHTEEQRKVLAVFNSPQLKEELAAYDLEMNLNYQGTTSMNGFLLWAAKNREIPAIGCWVNVPFYLVNRVDPRANKELLNFLNFRFDLGVDLSGLDREIEIQDRRIARIRKKNFKLDEYMGKLEQKIDLSQEEIEGLVEELDKFMG